MKRVLCATAVLCTLSGAQSARAGSELIDPVAEDTDGINAGAVVVSGRVQAVGSFPARWIAEVAAIAGECLRLDVLSQADDLEIVVVAPEGSVYRNDDRAPGDLRPLVAIEPTPRLGYYTVSIGHFGGIALNGSQFTLAYGRYSGTTSDNCDPETVPAASQTVNAATK